MVVGRKEPVPGHAARADDRGVSPVVGMILVLAISIVGIAAILYWGLPAIDEMKANVEYRSLTTQFSELDSTIHELIAGTTEKTAKRWEPSLQRGSVIVANRTEGWVYATELYDSNQYNFTYGSLDDGDNSFTIALSAAPNPDLPGLHVDGYIVTGSSSATQLNVTDGSVAAPNPMGSTVTWTKGTTKTFTVWQKDVCCGDVPGNYPKQNLRDATFHFKILSNGKVVAEMWWVQTGRVVYDLHAGVGDKSVTLNNGAVITGAAGNYAIVNSPSLPPDTTSSGVPRFFGRIVALNGSASFAGDNRFSLLVSLDSTSTLASYDCVRSDHADCVQSVKFQMFGTYANVWETYLKNTAMGYRFQATSPGVTGNVIYEYSNAMAFTLLGSNLRVSS